MILLVEVAEGVHGDPSWPMDYYDSNMSQTAIGRGCSTESLFTLTGRQESRPKPVVG